MRATRRSIAGAALGLVALLATACARPPGAGLERCERRLPPVWDPPAHAAIPDGEPVRPASLAATTGGDCVRMVQAPMQLARRDGNPAPGPGERSGREGS